jgi:hypothetical protein
MNNKNYISFNGSRTDFETTDFFEEAYPEVPHHVKWADGGLNFNHGQIRCIGVG